MMKESRQRQLLDGQRELARKVFEGVPIQVAYSENEIVKAMRDSHITVAAHTVRACLLDMKDVGLIKEPVPGKFQRVPVKPFLRLSTEPTQPPVSEPVMQPATEKKPEPSPLDLLGAVATELVLLGTEFNERMRAMSLRLEEIALKVEETREGDAKIIAQANQLKTLLKGFGE